MPIVILFNWSRIGIIGFLLYLGIFLTAGYFDFIIVFKSDLNNDKKGFVFLLLISLAVYFIDANLNFPIARPQVLAPWALTMAFISYYYSDSKNIFESKKIIILLFSPVNNSFDASFNKYCQHNIQVTQRAVIFIKRFQHK